MFRVVWLQIALDELADAWLQGDSALRKAITAASHDIDQRLGSDPHEEGESRPGERRLTFAAPLAVTFQIEPDGRTVTVLQARVFRTRKS